MIAKVYLSGNYRIFYTSCTWKLRIIYCILVIFTRLYLTFIIIGNANTGSQSRDLSEPYLASTAGLLKSGTGFCVNNLHTGLHKIQVVSTSESPSLNLPL